MRRTCQTICLAGFLLIFAAMAWGQSSGSPSAPTKATDASSVDASTPASNEGAGREIGRGGEDIGKGVAQGTADLARGTAGGIGSLAHGRVGSAVGDVGKGVGETSKTVAVGTAKGAVKIGKGIGGEFRKL